MRTPRNALAVVGVAVVAVTALLAPRAVPSGTQSVLGPANLAATWTSPDGGSITFARDHGFAATGLRLDKFWTPCAGAGTISVSGTWQFLDANGDSGLDPAGSMVGLTFDGAAANPAIGCTGGGIMLTTWNAGLCLQFDPDTPCDGYIFSKRLPGPTGCGRPPLPPAAASRASRPSGVVMPVRAVVPQSPVIHPTPRTSGSIWA